MQTAHTSLFHRHDTILGACEGVGEDFGINAQLLRIALAGLFFWNPAVAIGAYALLAVSVYASRRFFPRPAAAPHAGAPVGHANDAAPVELAAAA